MRIGVPGSFGPMFILNSDIVDALCGHAKVKCIKHEMSTCLGLEGVATGVGNVVMVGNRNQVPHLLSVHDPDTGDIWECLVTILQGTDSHPYDLGVCIA